MESDRSRPHFAGLHALLTLIQSLYHRPRFFTAPSSHDRRGDQPLPLVCLHRDRSAANFLPALKESLDSTLPQVPHTLLDADEVADTAADDAAEPLLPLLHALQRELGKDELTSGGLGEFDNYKLVEWLTRQHLPPEQGKRDRPVVNLLREWTGGRPGGGGLRSVVAEVPHALTRFVLSVVLWIGQLLGMRWLAGRVPGLGAEARWIMGQRFMVPRHSTSFQGFAERLTLDRRASESEEQIKKLLLHAFLEDLRIAYRRRRWRIVPRRPGWRRTTYVTVLLDNIGEANGGWELLRLINEVRNETGRLDPLLVVAATDDPPRHPEEPAPSFNSAVHANEALSEWRRRLPTRRQKLAPDARYLHIELPVDASAAELSQEDHTAWQDRVGWHPRRAPLLARRYLCEALVLVLLTAGLIQPTLTVSESVGANCAVVGPWSSGTVSTRVSDLGPAGTQCLGYSDSAAQVFGSNERLRYAQSAVHAQNERAKRLHEGNPDRPYVTLVYFAGLTNSSSGPRTDHAVAEELEGLLLRQREQNTRSDSEPLLRIVVANGGTGMRGAPEVARELLVPLVESDPTILGVVGMDRSVVETEQAIRILGEHGVPVLGSTLTSTGLAELTPLYFQLVPGNERQAELLGSYAAHVDASRITVYHPPTTGRNTYAATLLRELTQRLRDTGIALDKRGWKRSVSELEPLCAERTDRRREIAFYAGRENAFGDFLRAVRRNCTDSAELPRIVASDAVSRFVADSRSREHADFNGVTVSYVGLGSPVVLAGRDCVAGRADSLPGAGPQLSAFCAGYHGLREELRSELPDSEVPDMPWPGERVGGLYDAAGLFVDAVFAIRLQRGPAGDGVTPHRAEVAQQLRALTFEGATGTIDFGRSRIADERSLAVLRIRNINELAGPEGTPSCVHLIGTVYGGGHPDTATGCPRGG
ncbi:ABC transporter substrate-binding protein [Actinopolyspora saharensis]|uniref:ABC-type branched-chain amino acid transport system, substrate-binding protein n=1 Tax=Actinopolyspora saharensis TaxID=995062 RepID=A0A1H0YSM6_9ACTN|nr:hypothetical protein [Actinopolyspora saharensis]SDQ18237.1 hypothetical protein SAMN04489718_0653 [Actinopolyspora saharensis]